MIAVSQTERFLAALHFRALHYNPDEARDYHGRWAPEGGEGGGKPTDERAKSAAKVARALKSHKPSTKKVQKLADDGEKEVVAMIQGKSTGDNKPMDVTTTIKGRLHAVEVKTLVHNANDKITMHKPSLARKMKYARKTGAITHTVVLDKRTGRNYSGNKIYYRRGLGSFRIHTLTKVRDAAHLRELMSGEVKK
jgi:hypothetical protein